MHIEPQQGTIGIKPFLMAIHNHHHLSRKRQRTVWVVCGALALISLFFFDHRMMEEQSVKIAIFQNETKELTFQELAFPEPTFQELTFQRYTARAAAAATMRTDVTHTIRLFHVLNIYAINKDDYGGGNGNNEDTEDNDAPFAYQPFDQWVTLQSIQRAKEFMPPGLEMTLVCAILKSDWDILTKERVPICDHRIRLDRSTLTEYGGKPKSFDFTTVFGPNNYTTTNPQFASQSAEISEALTKLFSERELPFPQDVLDAGISVAEEQRKTTKDKYYYYHVMMTNADIGLSQHFYGFMLEQLKAHPRAFQLNRVGVPYRNEVTNQVNIPISEPTTNKMEIEMLLRTIENALPDGTDHPGTDCFVIHSAIAEKIRLGDQFAGYPAWAGSLKIILKDILTNHTYTLIHSNPHGTFHIGNDKEWFHQEEEDTAKDPVNDKVIAFLQENYREEIADCPIQRVITNVHTAVNLIHCGIVFQKHYEVVSKRRRFIREKKAAMDLQKAMEEEQNATGIEPVPKQQRRRY